MQEKKEFKMNWNLAFLVVFLLIIIFVIVRLIIWDKGVESDYDPNANVTEFDVESMDYILPLNPSLLEGREDDGVNTIVCLGNAPFADDRDSDKNLANLIAQKTDSTVYNCSVADSYMTALLPAYSAEHPYDAFSFYWLTTVFTVDNGSLIDSALETIGDVPADLQESMDLLRSIDFETVDVIAIMYDGNDYLGGRQTVDSENTSNIRTFTGALAAGIQLIQQTYPHIRIIVMSPTYAYALDENGGYASSDLTDYGMGPLSTYAILESNICYDNSVTFVDNIYASINEDNADTYLTDYIHINEAGRELLADRFGYALNMYQGVKGE